MANENKEIGDIVKKCKILLLDIEGTTTSISFVKDKLFPYAEENVKQFLDSQWETAEVKETVAALRKLSIEDKDGSVEGVVLIPGEDASKEDQIEGLVNNVKWQMSADRKAGPLKQLQGLIWKQGYDKGDIKGHVFDDVSAALEAWRSADGQKVYIYSSGSVQAQKLLFGQSMAGDLLKYIDGHFDTAVGPKQEAASYTNIVEKIGCKADEILFLTDIVKEAEAARAAGLHAALVSRAGNAPLPAAPAPAPAPFPVLLSLAELSVSNKRKPDPQDEETTPAAKILKTDIEQEVKSTAETVAETAPTAKKENLQMEVEDKVNSSEESKKPPVVKEQIIVEELDSNDSHSVTSVVDVEPAAVEHPKEDKEEKTEQKETEKKKGEIQNGKDEAPVPQETPPPVEVMEVEEVTDDKPLPDVAEIIEDVVPIVEEPDNVEEMEDLKNVGDVLEKECDEIMSKVNNVTNLETITSKPVLNSIAEETMETDCGDTSDIVEGILDTEQDLEMKQCSDIDPNMVTDIADEAKTEIVENKDVKKTDEKEIKDKVEIVSEKKDVDAQELNTEKDKQVMETETENTVSDKKNTTKEKVENVTENKEAVSENNVDKNVKSSPLDAETQDTKKEDAQNKKKEDVQNKESQVEVSTAEKTSADTIPKENESVEKKTSTEEAKPTEVEKVTEEAKLTEVDIVKESTLAKPEEGSVTVEKPTETAPQASKDESKETQLNGTTANGDVKTANGDAKTENGDAKTENGDAKTKKGDATDVAMNGDGVSKEELSSRLTDGAAENGKVNGSNGDSMEVEKGQGDCKTEPEKNDIKVKSVTKDEPRTDPIEQPTEA